MAAFIPPALSRRPELPRSPNKGVLTAHASFLSTIEASICSFKSFPRTVWGFINVSYLATRFTRKQPFVRLQQNKQAPGSVEHETEEAGGLHAGRFAFPSRPSLGTARPWALSPSGPAQRKPQDAPRAPQPRPGLSAPPPRPHPPSRAAAAAPSPVTALRACAPRSTNARHFTGGRAGPARARPLGRCGGDGTMGQGRGLGKAPPPPAYPEEIPTAKNKPKTRRGLA